MRHRNNQTWLRRTVAACVGLALVAAIPGPAVAQASPVTFTDSQVRDLLLGTAMRVYDPYSTYDKHLVVSAEGLGWRAAHPAATKAEIAAHMADINQSIETSLTPADRARAEQERLGRLLEIVYHTPGAAIGSPQLANLLGAVAAKDALPWVIDIEERLNGGRQGLYTGAAYGRAQLGVWAAVSQATASDVAMRDAWHDAVSQPASIGDPPAPNQPVVVPPELTLDYLAGLAKIKDLVTVDALLDAGEKGQDEFLAELEKQFGELQKKLTDENNKIGQIIDGLLGNTGLPGAQNEGPTAAELKKALAEEADRQEIIDGVKGALDFLGGLLDEVDPELAKQFTTLIDTAYKIATNANKLVTGLMTLASSTGIGASTLGVVGGIIGAAIGLIQLFAGLFSSDDDAAKQQAMEHQQLMQMIRDGFNQIKAYLEQIHQQMHDRFDRIDQALNQIYAEMLHQFAVVIDLLLGVQADLSVLRAAVAALQDKVENVYLQLHASLATVASQDFFGAAGMYVDYERQNGHPIQSYDADIHNYVDAVEQFEQTATYLAGQPPFVPDPAVTDTDQILTAVGPVGAIRYLSDLARTTYGATHSPAAPTVRNGELVEQAARAYTIVGLQNTNWAKQEPTVRVTSVMAAGNAVLSEAKKLSAPKTPTANSPGYTNALFTNLLTKQQLRTVQLAQALAPLEKDGKVMWPARQFDLFGPATQDVDTGTLAAPPSKVAKCGGTEETARPSFVDGTQMSKPLLLGRYGDVRLSGLGAGSEQWLYQPCWTNAQLTQIVDTIAESNCHMIKVEGPGGNWEWETVCDYKGTRRATVQATFQEWVKLPDDTKVLGRTAHGSSNAKVIMCSWDAVSPTSPAGPTGPCNPTADSYMPNATFKPGSASVDPTAGAAAATAMLKNKQAVYYKLVFDKLRDGVIPQAKTLNTQTRLLRAYTEVGFPRARAADDQLRALLYGTHAILADLPGAELLQLAFATAAANLSTGKDVLADQWLEAFIPSDRGHEGYSCRTVTSVPVGGENMGLSNKDPLVRCLVANAAERGKRLASRYELQSKRIAAGEVTETLPDLEESLRYLDLTSTYVHAPTT